MAGVVASISDADELHPPAPIRHARPPSRVSMPEGQIKRAAQEPRFPSPRQRGEGAGRRMRGERQRSQHRTRHPALALRRAQDEGFRRGVITKHAPTLQAAIRPPALSLILSLSKGGGKGTHIISAQTKRAARKPPFPFHPTHCLSRAQAAASSPAPPHRHGQTAASSPTDRPCS